MSDRGFVALVLVGSLLGVYLFVNAPPPLPEAVAETVSESSVSVAELLELCAAENAVTRQLYTVEIVGKGKEVGLKFDEKWRSRGVDAGPLPALFLRETASSLEKDPVELGLFLGSDFPISKANLFKGLQAEMFQQMRMDRKARHFVAEDLGLYTAMFPDLAVAPACVSCHNEHPDTTKRDWRLEDVMGATTWTYPKPVVSLGEALTVLAALRRGFRDAYVAYLDKVSTFALPPAIGDQWPADGYYLPTAEVFMREVERRVSPASLARLLQVP